MKNENVLTSIAKRGNGEIYLGVVGATRTGKSTFIKKFIENLVVPQVEDEYEKQKCLDEIPQSAQGKNIMTTEPKFVPSSGAKIKLDNFYANIKLVDCVGYPINGALGFTDEDGNPRMVKSPWYDDYIPLTEAAEIGTEKVIKDHATIAVIISSDGSITDIERNNYIEAEARIVNELKEYQKPFIMILNTKDPNSSKNMALDLEHEYNVPVIPCDIEHLKGNELENILRTVLYEYGIEKLKVCIPSWIDILPNNNIIKEHYTSKIKESLTSVEKLKDIDKITEYYKDSEYISRAYISSFDPGLGEASLTLESTDELYNSVLKEAIGDATLYKKDLLNMFINYKNTNEEFTYIKNALKMAKNTGYGILYPNINDMHLDSPEIIKSGSRYGVKLKAKASSIHLIKVDVESTFEPIIGTETQSKELVNYIMDDKTKDNIWKSEIFGRSIEQIVKEGIESKLNMMPDNTRIKLSSTVSKIVNKGSSNLIAIVI